MPELPASVRLALWATAALSDGDVSAEEALARATPDIDEVDGAAALDRIRLWADLGGRVVFVALPAPGDLVGLPRGDADFLGAVIDTGECAWSPLLGGALVPSIEPYGPSGDEGEIVRWEVHACAPTSDPAATSLGEVERDLRRMLVEAAEALEDLDVRPWDAGLRDLTDDRLQSGRWGWPPGLSPRAMRVLQQAAVLGTIATTALEHVDSDLRAPTLAAGERRESVLRAVHRDARRALAAATCAAAAELAGA